MKCIMIIAGSDSSGGAGVQADIKTAYKLGYHPATVISALTAQNSVGIQDIIPVPKEFISKQINAILEDMTPEAVKIGMLFSIDAIKLLADIFSVHGLSPIVLDPIIRASTGAFLLEEGGIEEMKRKLFPTVTLITPNKYEAEILSGININSLRDMEEAARILHDFGTEVVITGHYERDKVFDLAYDGMDSFFIEDEAIDTRHGHGSGCVFSTSIAIFLSQGIPLPSATRFAHKFTREAIKKAYSIGKGSGPVLP